MKPIRVVQYGSWFYTHAEHTMRTIRSLPDYFDVVGFCEPNPERLKTVLERPAYQGLKVYTADELLNDRTIDAVIVETEELNQAKDALMFAKAGFNIHSDKPCGADSTVFAELINVVKKNNIVFQNGYMYRYNPAIVKAHEIVNSGEIGELICVEAQMSQCYHGEGLSWLNTLPGGMMLYLGCHLIDLVYSFMGEPLEILPFNTSSKLEDKTVKDFGLTLLKYPHGYSTIKTVACEVSGDARRQFVISGTKGTIEIKPIENPTEISGVVCANNVDLIVTKPNHPVNFAERPTTYTFEPYGRYDDMMKDFALTVAGEKENTFNYETEIAVHNLITKICNG